MKKPLLGLLGVGAACAACCAIPLAVPLIGGASAAGLALLADWDGVLGVGLAAALVVAGGLWWSRQRKAAACKVVPGSPGAGSCGCDAT
jgi:hypothetical protein